MFDFQRWQSLCQIGLGPVNFELTEAAKATKLGPNLCSEVPTSVGTSDRHVSLVEIIYG